MNLLLRLCAGIIDLLQFIFFMVFLAFQVMTPYGGAALGGLTGAGICWNMSSGVFEGAWNAAVCALGGAAAGGIVSAIATPLGMAIDVAISATFGVLLILLLFVTGRFYLMPIAMGFAGEMMPGLNGFAPFWSILVHRCIQQYEQEKSGQKSSMSGSALKLATMIPGVGGVAKVAAPVISVAAHAAQAANSPQTNTRTPFTSKNFDGIRPANDNTPRTIYAKAA